MPLPEHNEPLRLADGRLVFPGGNMADPQRADVAIPEHVLPALVRRKASDLPAPPRQMNAICAVLCYTLFGLDLDEVVAATGMSEAQVARITDSDPYQQMREAVVRAVLDSETDVVRELLAKNARRAASTMVEALDAPTRADRMAAARDILDRSGHRPADVVEHRHRMDGGLVIEIVKRDEAERLPTIDVEAE